MNNQSWPEVAYLKEATPFAYGWMNHRATFPAGAKCLKASNLPPDADGRPKYWVDANPEPGNVVLASWLEHYGHNVDADAVTFTRPNVPSHKATKTRATR